MTLQFEYTLVLSEEGPTFLGHEPNNDLVAYSLVDKRINNKRTQPPFGDYSALTFTPEPRRITPHAVRDFGIKSFPRFGAYGFYNSPYSPQSSVVFPINRETSYGPAPAITVTDTSNTIHVVIESNYLCHRIIVRKGFFATEFITYEKEFDFLPMYDGECFITVIGHSDEITTTSLPFETTMTLTNRAALATPNQLPAGGTTGQVLTKVSNADFDTSWTDK